ncbi:mitogen-activated protein kinase kinase kinase 20-like, partial [Gastrolobium bilobum]|uniref:mitogen-activated protein kinase kinase kinase 20-like n=1 Tax=Gastrolobium bilobum TaxID=150636 RepID=UPI002AAF37C4
MVAPEKCIGNVVAVKSSMPHSIGSLMREESIIRSLIGCEELLQCHFGQFTIEKGEFIYNLGFLAFIKLELFKNDAEYCDLKPDNILLFPSSKNDAKYQLKIADFGLSKTKEEIINAENPPTSKEMIPTTNEMMYKLAVFEEAPKIPNGISEDCRDFLSKLFIKNPSQRWTASKLLHHPFLFSPYDSFRGYERFHMRNPPTSKEMIPTTNEMMYKLAVFEEAPKIPNGVSEDCRDFLSKRFIKNPSQRWTASKLLHHPFLFSPYDSFRGYERFHM